MKKILATAVALMASSSTAVFAACGGIGEPVCPPVPEISALEGTAAIAALAAIVLLTWERSRRRSA